MFQFMSCSLRKIVAPLLAGATALATVGGAGPPQKPGVAPRPPVKRIRPALGQLWLDFIGVTQDPQQPAEVAGVQLGDVDPTKWAAKAGLKKGDVIFGCDGTQISTVADLNQALSNGVLNAQDSWEIQYVDGATGDAYAVTMWMQNPPDQSQLVRPARRLIRMRK